MVVGPPRVPRRLRSLGDRTLSAAPQAYVLLGDGDSPHLLKWGRAP